jgi:3-phenylpropionate/cinnamic acid dioxygenase small subunit
VGDHDDIRYLLARFIHLRDDKRFDEWVALFVDDGVFAYAGKVLTGRTAIGDDVAALLRDDRGKHLSVNAAIVVDGDRADVVSDFVKLQRSGPGLGATTSVQVTGRYVDQLVRTDGGWRVARRDVVIDGFEEAVQ